MTRRFHVFVNEAAGSVDDMERQSDEIEAAFAAAGATATVVPIDPAELADGIRDAWRRGDSDAIVVAGGDGTISCAAGAAVEHGAVLGVLPMGTFNHFAKDLGVPGGLSDAAAYLAAAPVTTVDVGELNGRVFVNNASLGVYPQMVEHRDRIRDQRGWGKIRAVPAAMIRTLRDMPSHRLRIAIDGGRRISVTTSFLFVGNGLFDEGGDGVGTRASLTGSRLGVYVIATTSRWRLVRDAIRARIRGIAAARETDRRAGTRVVVDADEATVQVALDGEPWTVPTPLRFTVRAGALRVLRAPPEPEGEDAVEAVPGVAG